jgi:hypothetical protein
MNDDGNHRPFRAKQSKAKQSGYENLRNEYNEMRDEFAKEREIIDYSA